MDDENDNIFAAGSGEPKSDVATGDGSNAGTSQGVEGRIDPAIARTVNGGNGNASNRTADSSTGGSRGRPRLPRDAEGNIIRDGKSDVKPAAKETRNIKVKASVVEGTLVTAHMLLSKTLQYLTNNGVGDAFELDSDDAKKLGEAAANVLSYYNVKMTAKQQAYWELMNVAAEIYPAMFVTAYFNLKEAQPTQPMPQRPQQSPQTPQRQPEPPRDIKMPAGFDPTHITIPHETKQ